MKVANHQPQYLPYLGFFHKVLSADLLVMMDDVQFMDRGFQHRNQIKMQTGSQMLTVPLNKQRDSLIRDVVIDPAQPWRRKHWAAIQTNYSRAPFWKQYSDELRAILLEGKHTHLLALDMDLMCWAMRALAIDVPIKISTDLGVTGEKSERHINICRAVGADTYVSGPGGHLYMDMALFEAAQVKVEFQVYAAREYPQLYPQHGFIANLCVLDALFNVGPAARELLEQPSP